MERVVILGAGFGGLAAAEALDPLAGMGKVGVTLVDRSSRFSMGFSMQWVFVGRRRPEEGERAYATLALPNVTFLQDEVAQIDTGAGIVHLRSRKLGYDHLVVATGAELAPETVPGLAEGAYNLCSMESVQQFRAAVDRIESGTVLIAIASMPFKCPPAPYEYAFLVDDLLRDRGVRDRVKVVMTTPESQPMPVAGKAVGEQVKGMLAEKGIEYRPGRKPKAVDIRARKVSYENGPDASYDLLAAMPPHRAPRVVREAGLTDESGFVPVELGTFATKVKGVYAVGDVAAVKLPNGMPHPKAGVFAEAQGLRVGTLLAAALGGNEAGAYGGKGVCYIDTGDDKASPAEVDLLGAGGPTARIDAPSVEGLMGKRRFERERFSRWFGE